MEFIGKFRIETYHPVAKVNRGNEWYVSVFYGWWSFTFLMSEDEHVSPALIESAKEQCVALLMLEDDEIDIDYLRWATAVRRLRTDRCSKRAVTGKGKT